MSFLRLLIHERFLSVFGKHRHTHTEQTHRTRCTHTQHNTMTDGELCVLVESPTHKTHRHTNSTPLKSRGMSLAPKLPLILRLPSHVNQSNESQAQQGLKAETAVAKKVPELPPESPCCAFFPGHLASTGSSFRAGRQEVSVHVLLTLAHLRAPSHCPSRLSNVFNTRNTTFILVHIILPCWLFVPGNTFEDLIFGKFE